MAFTYYEIDHSPCRFKPISADRPFVSAVALTHAPVRKSQTDLRFLDRDRANTMVFSFRGGVILKESFNETSMRFLDADRIIGCRELKDFIYENRSRISASRGEYDSVDAFRQDQDTRGQRIVPILEDLGVRMRLGMCLSHIWYLYHALVDPEWLKLARMPKRYNKELNQRIRALVAALKYLHGVPGHRSQLHADRDRDLWLRKRKDPSLSWGQLGLKFGISDGAAQSAYKRQLHREVARLQCLRQTVENLYRRYEGDEQGFQRLLGGIGPPSAPSVFSAALKSSRTDLQIEKRGLDLRFLLHDRADSMVRSFCEGQESEHEFIWRGLYSFRFFEIVHNPELRAFVYENRSCISRACEKYDSVDAFRQNQGILGQRCVGVVEDLSLRVPLGLALMNIYGVFRALTDPDWLELARTPARY